MDSLRRVASRAAPVAEVDQVRKAVHSFPSTSGAGRSGLRPSHIRDALRIASSDLLLRLITEVVNPFLQGEVPESVRPFVCGASIMALRKPNGTLRPIAVGEIFRRNTSKVAVELISDRARTVLEPLQLGVLSSNGCEAIVLRQWFHRHRSDPSKTAISVDISNAFNTVHRSAVLQSTQWTAVIATTVISSRAPALLVIRLFPTPCECNRATLQGLSSLLWPFTPSSRKLDSPLRTPSHRASTFAPSVLTMAFCARRELLPFCPCPGPQPRWSYVQPEQNGGHPGMHHVAAFWSRLEWVCQFQTARGSYRTSLMPSAVSLTLRGPSASSGLALGGPRFSTHAVPFRPMFSLQASSLLIPTFARPSDASLALLSLTTIGA